MGAVGTVGCRVDDIARRGCNVRFDLRLEKGIGSKGGRMSGKQGNSEKLVGCVPASG